MSDSQTARLQARPWSKIAERVYGPQTGPGELRRALPVIVTTSLAAIAVAFGLYRSASPERADVVIAAALVVLGFAAEFLPFHGKSRAAAGSVAFVPYVAAILVAPDYRVLAAIVVAQVGVQAWHRRPTPKAVFNVAQFALATGTAIFAFRALMPPGIALKELSFLGGMLAYAAPLGGAFAMMTIVNATCVSTIIAVTSREPLWPSLLRALKPTPILVLLQMVISFYVAWLAVHLGGLGTLGMVLPLLAVRQLSRTTIELTRVTEELLDLMVAAIEARDPYTSGHSKRVAAAATKIAKAVGLKAEEVERVQVAALLHDVGKIHEEFARVLAKEGRLTPEEWEVMKRHPVRSAELVALVSSLRDVVPAVRHHHENWDGTGYPDGKRGTEIPLASRIIMFADTLDAITTDRPYRRALNPDEARKEFEKFKGRQFDPGICEVVVSPAVWAELYQTALASQRTTVSAASSVA